MVEVYTWEPNANAGKSLLCLHEKQVPFVHHYIDMGAREHHQPPFLAINPGGTVPALVHDGLVLTESTPMMEYIDDAIDSPSLRPADPALRWRMRWVMRVIDNSVCPALAMIASNTLAAPRFRETPEDEKRAALARIPDPERRRTWDLLMHDATPPEEIEESKRRVAEGLALLERMLGEYPYLAGSDFSLADICTMATFYHLPVSRPDEVGALQTPNLWAWLARCHARPGLQGGFAMGRDFTTERARQARLSPTRCYSRSSRGWTRPCSARRCASGASGSSNDRPPGWSPRRRERFGAGQRIARGPPRRRADLVARRRVLAGRHQVVFDGPGAAADDAGDLQPAGHPAHRGMAQPDGGTLGGAGARALSCAPRAESRLSFICEARSGISVSFVQQHGANRAIPLAGRNFAA